MTRSVNLDAMESPELIKFSPNSQFIVSGQSPFYEWLAAGGRSPLKEDRIPGGQLTLIPLETAERPATYNRIEIPAGWETLSDVVFSPDGRFMLASMKYPEDKPARLYQLINNGAASQEINLKLPKESVGTGPGWKF